MSNSSLDSEISCPFIFEKVTQPIVKIPAIDNLNTYLSVNTKPWSNQHLPFPKDFKFNSMNLGLRFENHAYTYREFKVRKDDVWILSFPKSGSTWLENIVCQLKNGFDFSKIPTCLWTSNHFERDLIGDYGQLEKMNNEPSPRIIKSHLSPNLLPIELWTVQPKIIYIARDPKDVAISWFHMMKDGFNAFSGTIEEYFDLFLDEKERYGPFHAHVLTYWQLRHLDNFLFLNYENLLADSFRGIKKIAKFLDCTYGDDELKQLTEYTSFGTMQKLNSTPDNNYQ